MDGVNRNQIEHVPADRASIEYTPAQVDLIKRTIADGCSDDELALFLHVCQRTGLDPFARQIYAIRRGVRMTIQTGIDGYRLIADRTGCYMGNAEPVFEHSPDGQPTRATVTVWKLVHGQRCPFTATAFWDEFCPARGQDQMWRKMPHTMLAKVAESLALRKAFPADLSGVYTTEEMSQAAGDDTARWQTVRARGARLPDSIRAELNRWVLADRPSLDEVEARVTEMESRVDYPGMGILDADPVQEGGDYPPEDPPSDAGDDGRASGSHPAAEDSPGGPPPPGPVNTARAARYAADKTARDRGAEAMRHTLDAARYDDSPLDLATRAGLR
jgi:phage recombination protein Bet